VKRTLKKRKIFAHHFCVAPCISSLSLTQRRRQTEKIGRRQPLKTWATRIIPIRSTFVLITTAATLTITMFIPCFMQRTLVHLLLSSLASVSLSPKEPSSIELQTFSFDVCAILESSFSAGLKNIDSAVAVAPSGVASWELSAAAMKPIAKTITPPSPVNSLTKPLRTGIVNLGGR